MKATTQTPQEYADSRYAFRRLNNFSGASANTAEDVAEKFPELSDDQVNDIVFEATVNFQEQN